MHACSDHASCVNEALHEADRVCAKKGLRFTTLRRKVLRLIWNNHGPAKAYAILDQLNRENASAKPSTVYRTLDFLMSTGLIHKVNSLNAYVGCSHPLRHNECYFLICKKCDEIQECCDRGLSQAITETTNKNKFNANGVTLEITGECLECITKNRT